MSSISRRGFVGLAGVLGASTLLGCSALEHGVGQRSYDVCVVGAGVVGCCCARELARYNLSVLVVEAGLDIANGATRANSGIVHAGFDPKPGTLKARYNVAGAAVYPRWQEELGFTYMQNGALVLAFDDNEQAVLNTLADQAVQNGVEVEILDAAGLRALEPEAPVDAVAALHVPTSAIVDPYGVAFAAAENAADNGVEFVFGRKVAAARRTSDGFEVTLDAAQGTLAAAANVDGREASALQTVACRCILNAAGIHADTINNMLSARKLKIQPKRGEYLLYQGHSPFTYTMFQAPTSAGKGVLVGQAVFGNVFVGPNSVPQKSKSDVSTTAEGIAGILEKARKTWPDASDQGVISTFAGLRASNADGGDFVVGQAEDVPGLFNAACIDSPGLASAPAIAEDLAAGVADYLKAKTRENFNPKRQTKPLFNYADDETKARLLAEDSAYGTVVCSCYGVTEAEVLSALRGELPVYALDAIKWRTGATMGQCQGGRCMAKIAQLVADELDLDAKDLEKRLAGSTLGIKVIPSEVAGDIVAKFDEDRYEAPRASYLIPGTRPAGIYSARGVLELMASDRVLPGKNAVVWGATDLAGHACEALEAAGTTVTRLDDADRIAEIVGSTRIESVRVERGGDRQTLPCDVLVISKDLVSVY